MSNSPSLQLVQSILVRDINVTFGGNMMAQQQLELERNVLFTLFRRLCSHNGHLARFEALGEPWLGVGNQRYMARSLRYRLTQCLKREYP